MPSINSIFRSYSVELRSSWRARAVRCLVLSGWLGAGLHGCARFGYELLTLDGEEVPLTCGNRTLDPGEVDVDCGGDLCPGCAVGVACDLGGDCMSAVCLANICQPPTCGDAAQNGDETGVDCGGASCGACATCSDGAQNQDETGTDCGGSVCVPCDEGIGCAEVGDCGSAVCTGSICQAPSCSDAVQNQDETGVDCGGTSCGACATCSDGAQNQDETGVDCGGNDCLACDDGCGVGSDCASAVCLGNICQAPTCGDGVRNQDETGTDCGGAACGACPPNTPPLPQLAITPGVGSHDGTPPTVFLGDAAGTSDLEDAPNALTYSWDWENDGVIDATGLTSTHSYGAAGTFEVRLVVQDSSGLSASTTSFVIVSPESDVLQVTTAVDENDGGATPASPGGAGLSLREAMTFANSSAGKQSILVPSGFVIALGSQLPALTDGSGVDLVGDGAVLDGSGAGSVHCLQIATSQTRVFGFEIRNCAQSPLRVGFVTDIHISRLFIHDNGQAVSMDGTGSNVFGPNNVVSRSASHGMTVFRATTIERNEFHDNTLRGLDITGSADGCVVIGNVITGSDPGIFISAGSDDNVIVHNTLHANTSQGADMSNGVSGTVLQNNIFSSNALFGVDAGNAQFSVNDHNDYFANTSGTCSSCSLGTGSLTSDPEYVDAPANDFRLRSFSLAADAGVDTGRDVNGSGPGDGLFNGASPDIGARETP